MRETSVPIRLVRAVLKHCGDFELDQRELLAQAGISPRLVEEEAARVSIERFAQLQVVTILAMQDEGLGYLTRRLPVGTWSMMCHATRNARSFREALNRYCRFFTILDMGFTLTPVEDGDSAGVRFTHDPGWPVDLFISERALFKCSRYSSWLMQEDIVITAVALSGADPGHGDEYRFLFNGAPVTFDLPFDEIRFSASYLDRAIALDDQTVRRFLRAPTLMLLSEEYRNTSWTNRVRRELRKDMPHLKGMEEIADALAVHPQTLRRRLADEGQSFKQIIDDLHRDTALYYLGRRGMSVEEVAWRAGFAETSTFIRAFKRWTAMTPYAYRKGL
ncbi:AraC family transcriptional regulator [Sphingobium sp. JS3065]|uniref:AraC family transcriptional regulator n=1 Tax=Sphingobium sp. JS3065 TaxID=2970925 RepID=UPI002263BDC2|nr:AraC family transcriptional regulator [Sphingobium sp. JS3065]UZW56001.1 AraC family transcriptional regulator [Sphingobium sp. JS3065]